MKPRIYLAGPEVFLPDAVEAGERKKVICELHGFEGVYPLDSVLDLNGLSPRDAAFAIGRANEDLIRSCQMVVANITPFRGPSADVGTVYEMGFGAALGLRVSAYTNVPTDLLTRTQNYLEFEPHMVCDDDGMRVESFGLRDNLMIEQSIDRTGGRMVIHHSVFEKRFVDLNGFNQLLFRLQWRYPLVVPLVFGTSMGSPELKSGVRIPPSGLSFIMDAYE